MSTPVSSRYDWREVAAMNRRRGNTTRAAYQKQATIKRINTPVEYWSDRMGCNCGPIPSSPALDKVHSLGLRWVTISPEMGWYADLKKATGEVTRIHDHGLLCHVVLQVAGHDYGKAVANPNEWVAYGKAFADAGCDAMTPLNEPNNKPFWQSLDPGMYGPAWLAGMVTHEIRMDHPTLPIYAPGWSPAGGDFAPMQAMTNFIFRLKEYHFPPMIFTGPSMHPYAHNGVKFGLPNHSDWNAFAQTPSVEMAATGLGMPGPISLSEWGVPSAGTQGSYPNETFTETSQAKKIQDQLDGYMEWRRDLGIDIAFMCISTAIDGDAATNSIEQSMGLFREDGTEKPAADIIRQFAKKEWDLAYSA